MNTSAGVPVARLVGILRAQAKQMARAPDDRHEDFEEDAVVWALKEAARRLVALEKLVERLESEA